MAKGAKLKDALDRHQGVDHTLERQKKLQKQALKRKRSRTEEEDQDEESRENNVDSATKSSKKDDAKSKKQKLSSTASPNLSKKSPKGNVNVNKVAQTSPGSDDWATAEEDNDEEAEFDLARLQDSDTSDSENEAAFVTPKTHRSFQVASANGKKGVEEDEDENEDEEEEEEDIPLSDVDSLASEEMADVVPHQRLTINNTSALLRAYNSISLPSDLPFSLTQAVTAAVSTDIPDIDDDLTRELAFYKQSLDAVLAARELLKKEGIAFSRPADYFAEMAKSDEHMGKIKKKLVDDAASKKAASEARRQRDLKKFGKQVQVAKLQERDKAKRETLDRIKLLKKKRSGSAIENANEADMFDVALEGTDETQRKDRAARKAAGSSSGKPNMKRAKKDEKFGFGGKKRYAKSNDATSSADMSGYSVKKMKGKTKNTRPGKNRRAKMG